METRQDGQGVAVDRLGLRLHVPGKEGGSRQEAAQVGGEPLLDEGLEGLGPGFLGEMDAVCVALVPPFAVLPGHDRVVLVLVEPGADKAVAALDLVVQEGEGKGLGPSSRPRGTGGRVPRPGDRSPRRRGSAPR